MEKEEVKQYIKDNLKIIWQYEDDKLFIKLELEGETISKIPFEQY